MKPPAESATAADTTAATQPANARVCIITHALRIGDHLYAAGHVIQELPLAEAEFRAKAGELEILNLVP